LSLSTDLGDGRRLEICIKTSLRARRLRLVSGVEGVQAIVPPDFSSDELAQFVTSKQDWLRRTSRYYERLREKCGEFDGSMILYRGTKYRYTIVADRMLAATVSEELKMITFHVPDRRRARAYQQAWFRQQTEAMIMERLPALAGRMGMKYNKVSVRKQKSRWGSCSRKGNLNFNLMLAAVPPEVLDYVIIHELAHLKVLNHSPQFWEIVRSADPDYKSRREWLSNYAPLIKTG
jgi:predicted metal-dependent hydrolase